MNKIYSADNDSTNTSYDNQHLFRLSHETESIKLDDSDENSSHFAAVMSTYRPQEASLFQQSYEVKKSNSYSSSSSLFSSSELFQGLEFLKSSSAITDPSHFVNNYAPTEPYTILSLSFRSKLGLDMLVNLLNEYLMNQPNLTFQVFSTESVWHIEYKYGNMILLMQINIYRGRLGQDHVIEGQRCDGERFLTHSIFQGIKATIEKVEYPERKHVATSQMDFIRLVTA